MKGITFCELKENIAKTYFAKTDDAEGYNELFQSCNLDELNENIERLGPEAEAVAEIPFKNYWASWERVAERNRYMAWH